MFPELKKNPFTGLSNTFETSKERVSDWDNGSTEIIQSE